MRPACVPAPASAPPGAGLWGCFGELLAAPPSVVGHVPFPFKEAAMKKIVIRKAGPVRLTTSGCHVYPAA